jgi:hypothetical protein
MITIGHSKLTSWNHGISLAIGSIQIKIRKLSKDVSETKFLGKFPGNVKPVNRAPSH